MTAMIREEDNNLKNNLYKNKVIKSNLNNNKIIENKHKKIFKNLFYPLNNKIDENVLAKLLDEYEKPKRYLFLADLNHQGGQAHIFKIFDYLNGSVCVCKQFSDIDDFNNEEKILSLIEKGINDKYFAPKHPNLLKFYGSNKKNIFIGKEQIPSIRFEYFKSKDLHETVEYYNGLSEKRSLKYFKQILNGIKFLHSLKIAHKDIKLENILINRDHIIKIIDFGLSIDMSKGEEYCYNNSGSPLYCSPEIAFSEKHDPFKADLWSLGILLYGMHSADFPYYEPSLYDKDYLEFISGNFKYPDNFSPVIAKIVKSLCNIDPNLRISIDQTIELINNYFNQK